MKKDFYVVGIGASAGGQQALQEFFTNIPARSNAAFIIVTHLSRDYKTNLHNILSSHASVPVNLVRDGESIRENRIYVMPENTELVVGDKRLHLEPRPDELTNNAIDRFFTSLAADLRHRAIGIVFSGAGTDGARGVQRIHNAGGKVYVQDPVSSIFSSMPLAAIKADHPLAVDTPAALARELVSSVLKSEQQAYRVPARRTEHFRL